MITRDAERYVSTLVRWYVGTSVKLCVLASALICCIMAGSSAAYATAPQRVVSLKPSITDVVYALGLGDRLIGVTRYCFAPDGMRKPEVVADYTRPYSERIVALSPDIVLGSMENSSRRSIESLEQTGIRVELFPFTTLADTMQSIRKIAAVLGEPARGEALARDIQAKLDALKARWSGSAPLRAVVVWGTRPLVVAGPGAYMDELLASVGAENAVRATKIKYPRIGLEELIAIDPDVIVDLSMGSEAAKSAQGDRPWNNASTLKAVREGKVIAMDAGMFRAGPRLVEGLTRLAELLHEDKSPSFVRRGKGR